eukprot:7116504-Pyramimonas_sp.AAC.1
MSRKVPTPPLPKTLLRGALWPGLRGESGRGDEDRPPTGITAAVPKEIEGSKWVLRRAISGRA